MVAIWEFSPTFYISHLLRYVSLKQCLLDNLALPLLLFFFFFFFLYSKLEVIVAADDWGLENRDGGPGWGWGASYGKQNKIYYST